MTIEPLSLDENAAGIKYFVRRRNFPAPILGSTKPLSIEKDKDQAAALLSLARRLDRIESALVANDASLSVAPGALPVWDDPHVRRAASAVDSALCYSAVWRWVSTDYYGLDLEERAAVLGAYGTDQLCKSMLMENRAYCGEGSALDRTNARFYLVVLQYTAAIDGKKLESEVRALRGLRERLDPSKFNFQVASEEDNGYCTGYPHNAVTPFGIDPSVPIIFASAIMQTVPNFVWMGGGHQHLKLGIAVNDFICATDAIVIDVTKLR
uniref:YbaK/aminoacyl-tRNA synthetase-associated domain-containing protein n=1 Tax=Corethron hystrix TaxID=216773 RepID=A0A7S1FL94_9STRA|mmetsp:Transcript_10139/g.22523  ORF Transcript_10139/g.22523 Transcript_10139/m.22523 type:complete len:267 (+) Transcript_10139:124-924(+)